MIANDDEKEENYLDWWYCNTREPARPPREVLENLPKVCEPSQENNNNSNASQISADIQIVLKVNVHADWGKRRMNYWYLSVDVIVTGLEVALLGLAAVVKSVDVIHPLPVQTWYDTRPQKLGEWIHQRLSSDKLPMKFTVQYGHHMLLPGRVILTDGRVVNFDFEIFAPSTFTDSEDDPDLKLTPLTFNCRATRLPALNTAKTYASNALALSFVLNQAAPTKVLHALKSGKRCEAAITPIPHSGAFAVEIGGTKLLWHGYFECGNVLYPPSIADYVEGNAVYQLQNFPADRLYTLMKFLRRRALRFTRALLTDSLHLSTNNQDKFSRPRGVRTPLSSASNESSKKKLDPLAQLGEDLGLDDSELREVDHTLTQILQKHDRAAPWPRKLASSGDRLYLVCGGARPRYYRDREDETPLFDVKLKHPERLAQALPASMLQGAPTLASHIMSVLQKWETESKKLWTKRLTRQSELGTAAAARVWCPWRYNLLLTLAHVTPSLPQELQQQIALQLPPALTGGVVFGRETSEGGSWVDRATLTVLNLSDPKTFVLTFTRREAVWTSYDYEKALVEGVYSIQGVASSLNSSHNQEYPSSEDEGIHSHDNDNQSKYGQGLVLRFEPHRSERAKVNDSKAELEMKPFECKPFQCRLVAHREYGGVQLIEFDSNSPHFISGKLVEACAKETEEIKNY